MELLKNCFFLVTFDPERASYMVKRSAAPFETLEQMTLRFTEVIRLLDERGRGKASLLVDTTEAPPRNDPAFEKAFDPLRIRLLQGFRRAAVLVSTPVGRLQADRHEKHDNLSVKIFADKSAAEAYVWQK